MELKNLLYLKNELMNLADFFLHATSDAIVLAKQLILLSIFDF